MISEETIYELHDGNMHGCIGARTRSIQLRDVEQTVLEMLAFQSVRFRVLSYSVVMSGSILSIFFNTKIYNLYLRCFQDSEWSNDSEISCVVCDGTPMEHFF